jgi:hypothetical protein
MKTTRIYLHLAGTVFRDEAEALGRRLLCAPSGGTDPRNVKGSFAPSETVTSGRGGRPVRP